MRRFKFGKVLALILILALGLSLMSGCATGVWKFSAPIEAAEKTLTMGDLYLAYDQEITCYLAKLTSLDRERYESEVKPEMYRAGGSYEELAKAVKAHGLDAAQANARKRKPAEVMALEAELAARLEQVNRRLTFFRAKYPGCGGER